MTRQQSLGNRIAQARREKAVRDRCDITQADLAEAVGVSAATVSRWEADTASPREDVLAKLASYLRTTPAFLRYGTAEREEEVVPAPGRSEGARAYIARTEADGKKGTA